MAKQILPYRNYSEHDVVNLFSLNVDEATDTLTEWVEASNGKWDAGVVVKVKDASLPGDLYNAEEGFKTTGKLRAYLGSDPQSAHIGYNAYPSNGMTVETTDADDVAVGITLRETLAYDENGEKLLYYKRKLDEAQAVLPGQTVPVLTRGTVLLKTGADTVVPAGATKGYILSVGANGTLVSNDPATFSGTSVGTVLATGTGKALCRISF